jgi:hypothetical protein
MTRTVFLGVALAFGLATVAGAAVTPAPVGNANSLVIKAAEGCGPGFWRGRRQVPSDVRRQGLPAGISYWP